MNKQHIKELLKTNSEIIIETIEHERVTVEKIKDDTDDQYIHVLEPEEKTIEINKIAIFKKIILTNCNALKSLKKPEDFIIKLLFVP